MPDTSKKIRILLVDDHPLIREGIRACIEHAPHIQVVGEAGDGREAVQWALELAPDVVVMDVNMPRLNGLAATALLRQQRPDARVLVLTLHDQPEYLLEMIRVGARGCLNKESQPNDLIRAIEKVAAGEAHFALEDTVRFLRRYLPAPACALPSPTQALTAREREVLTLIGQGLTNREIAAQLDVAVRTVETHRERLMRKLDLHDTASLRTYASAQELLMADGRDAACIGD